MTKPRRKEIQRIESSSARSVCFSKRRKGLFKKADELRKLSPNFSITAIVFSPAGTPFVYGDTSSLCHVIVSAPSDSPRHHQDETRDLLNVDISGLGLAELESHARELQRLRSNLEGTDGRDDGFVRFTESGVNSEILDFRNFQPGSGFFDVDEGFVNVSGLKVDFGLDLDDFSISDLGSQFVDYGDIDGFLHL